MDNGRIHELFEGNEDVIALDMRNATVCTPTLVKIGGTPFADDDTTELSIAFHEVAHFIEASDERATLHDFGLTDSGDENWNQEALDREAEVFAIQVVLENHYGVAWGDRFWKSYSDMARFCLGVTHVGVAAEVEKFIEAKVAHWTIEAVLREFNRKVALLREAKSFALAA